MPPSHPPFDVPIPVLRPTPPSLKLHGQDSSPQNKMRASQSSLSDSGVEKSASRPHIVALAIHGGAGGTTTPDMPADLLAAYRHRLRTILSTTYTHNHATSLDAVCHAVTQLEDSPLFNAGKGAVFDLAGRTLCECSLMTTQPGVPTRTVAVTAVQRTKNPISLARVLLDKNQELGGHAFYSGSAAEKAGWKYGTTKVGKSYYFTQRRWNEHKRGLDKKLAQAVRNEMEPEPESESEDEVGLPAYTPSVEAESPHEDAAIFDRYANLIDFLPQGTVGAVALDSDGHLSVATSTGGKTNKYPGRIGDTPSVGSGFWANAWSTTAVHRHKRRSLFIRMIRKLCAPRSNHQTREVAERGVAISGTGDGDFFLRTNFASSIAHRSQYANLALSDAITAGMAELTAAYGTAKGVGGAIILDRQGKAYFPLAASTMNRGLISKATAYTAKVAIFDNEELA